MGRDGEERVEGRREKEGSRMIEVEGGGRRRGGG